MNINNIFSHIRFLINQGGIIKLFDHIKENILFDLIYGTETSSWLRKSDFTEQPKNFEYGVRYRASATSEVKNSLNATTKALNPNDASYYDLGCGKGKTLCLARKFYNFKNITGIDYYAPFLEVAQKNIEVFDFDDISLLNMDMTDFKDYDKNSIVFLYNPAGEEVLHKVRKNLETVCDKAIIIYNKPIHENVFDSWKLISRKTHRDPDHQTSIFGYGI